MTLPGAWRILVHGHRGARAMRPENTLPSFEYAIGVGVDALELDLAVTRDNVVVVSHDPVLQAPLCSGPRPRAVIRELTLAELREWDCGAAANPRFPKQQAVPGTRIPTLREVCTLAESAGVELNLEIKSSPARPEYAPPPQEFARLVLDEVRQHRMEERVLVQSFDFRTLRAMRKLAPAIRRSALFEDDTRDFRTIAGEAGNAPSVSPHHRLVTPRKVVQAHAAGIQVLAWTVNGPPQWARMAAAQVDGMITDDPAALIAWLKARGLR